MSMAENRRERRDRVNQELYLEHDGDITVRLPETFRRRVGERMGMLYLKRVLEDAPKNARDMLGFQIAEALVINSYAAIELDITRSLAIIATKQGVNLSTHQAAIFTKEGDAVFRRIEDIPEEARDPAHTGLDSDEEPRG